MAKVSLRIYSREIEGLIDQGQLDEAIAHCHHILKTFPKYLEAYRLLGKAFLESKRYNEAVDIFSRILVSVPDDFVSHVGMSIINDDQNKLDNAIWHMERAFEAQPSNAAIQGELQRLYGRRDGIEPPKIRMTRGALARMYVQGELYPQAISEIRAVLQQDPQRADMQVLLARAYFNADQKADASDMCGQLLKRYPYNFDANRILVELLPGTDRAESTQVHRLRVYELDPYATFTQGSVFNSANVADAAVSLERLDYSGQEVLMEQDWGTSLGIGLAPVSSGAPEPDWLRSGGVASDAGSQLAAQPQDEIPDFLRAAGWSESSGLAEESPSTFDETAVSELAPAELPDWMKAMAPSQPSQQPAKSIPPSIVTPKQPTSDTPDWLAGLGAMGAESGSPPIITPGSFGETEGSATDTPDWLGGTTAQPQQPLAAPDLPDWLSTLGAEKEVASTAAPMDQTSAWLKNLNGEQSGGAQTVASPDIPDWLSSGTPIPASSAPPLPATPAASLDSLGASAQEQDDAVSWLESLASKHGAKPEELVTDPNSRSDIPPEWVTQARDIAASQPPAQKPVASIDSLGASAQEQEDAVSWLESLASKHGAKPEELVTDPNSRSEKPPEWVEQARSIAESQPQSEEDQTGTWLRGLGSQDSGQDLFAPLSGAGKKSPAADDQETSEWLASLAGASSEPSDWKAPLQASGLSDWNLPPSDESKPLWDEPAVPQKDQDRSMFEEPQEPMFKETPLKETPASTDLPDWLRGFDEGSQQRAAAEESLPAWLHEEETLQPESEFESEHETAPTVPTDWRPVSPTSEPALLAALPTKTQQAAQAAPVTAQPKATRSSSRVGARQRTLEARPESQESTLSQAESELNRGDIPAALEHFERLIKKGKYLDEIIHDLREALYRYPVEVSIWQALGDAYMRSNRLQEALDAYTKAEELLR